jgi:hypothetical protein
MNHEADGGPKQNTWREKEEVGRMVWSLSISPPLSLSLSLSLSLPLSFSLSLFTFPFFFFFKLLVLFTEVNPFPNHATLHWLSTKTLIAQFVKNHNIKASSTYQI